MNMFFVDQMAMYSAYHRNPRNRATHFIGIPAIVLSLLVVLSWLPVAAVDAALLFLLAVTVLYLWLDWRIAIPTAVFYAVVYAAAAWIAGRSTAPSPGRPWRCCSSAAGCSNWSAMSSRGADLRCSTICSRRWWRRCF